jgi:single-strand selective monofunctional uracil DNA glycosylase
MDPVRISRALADATRDLPRTRSVAHVYRPLDYARDPHEKYLRRYGAGRRDVLLLGMNPGPFGMAQTGVPFGDVPSVRDFLGIAGEVHPPLGTHPARPIEGFASSRREVSGQRLWGWAATRFATAEAFFARFFVANYCPLLLLDDGGRNVTPDKLPRGAREPLERACDDALRALVAQLRPTWVVGIGTWAQGRARAALGSEVRVGRILHPSPASPRANRDWATEAERELRGLGIDLDGAISAAPPSVPVVPTPVPSRSAAHPRPTRRSPA